MAAQTTKYERVMNAIRERMISGEYPVGSQLPSEPRLQKLFGVSRVTVRLAVDGLVKDGLVERIQGKGSFVQRPHRVSRLVRESTVESFSQVAKASGFTPHTQTLKVEEIVATPELRAKFDGSTDKLLHTVRLRFLDKDPIFLESNYYPLPRFATLADYDLNGSLYEIFRDHFEITRLDSTDTTLGVVTAGVEEAKLLHRSVGFPLFSMKTVIFDQNKNNVQYGEQLIVSDRYQFKI